MILQIATQIAPTTNRQFLIQAVLILAVAAVGWMMLRTPAGARHQAGRRLATLAFVAFAIVAIVFPSVLTGIAHMVGVGRGTDLLLYGPGHRLPGADPVLLPAQWRTRAADHAPGAAHRLGRRSRAARRGQAHPEAR